MHEDQTLNLLRFNDLKARGIVNNWPTLLRWVRKGAFPPGKKIGPRSRAWTAEEVALWYAQRPNAPGA
jgi:predicted DNA-binding transcriptional regulator AlpA